MLNQFFLTDATEYYGANKIIELLRIHCGMNQCSLLNHSGSSIKCIFNIMKLKNLKLKRKKKVYEASQTSYHWSSADFRLCTVLCKIGIVFIVVDRFSFAG